jgi:sterol desaturase/sphingolipid hydroxylase (fatty acid hydroxylase superfamily)
MEAFLKDGAEIYGVAYFGAIIVVAAIEWILPRRAATSLAGVRWLNNFGVTVLGSILIRLLFPLAGVGWAIFCSDRGWGLLNQWQIPAWAAFILTIVILDLSHYAEHYLLHRVPVLWRLHRTHHTDLEYDFSTGVRFHPFEMVFSTVALMAVVAALGPPPVALLVSQVLTIVVDFIEHANARVPSSIDRFFRVVFVTPDMHRIHHSQERGEGNSNFSNMFSVWDRLFGTYVDQPAAGHDGIAFGVPEFTDRKHLTLHWMLVQPFLGEPPEGGGHAARAALPVTAAEPATPTHATDRAS